MRWRKPPGKREEQRGGVGGANKSVEEWMRTRRKETEREKKGRGRRCRATVREQKEERRKD